jgi:hypothetical protein
MKKQNVVILHPREWATAKYASKARFNYHHVNIGAPIPKKRNGIPTFDGYAEVVTEAGNKHFHEVVKRTKPVAILYWMHGGFSMRLLEWARKIVPDVKFIQWYSNHRFQISSAVKKALPYLDALLMNTDEPNQLKMYRHAGLKAYRFWDGFEVSTPLVDVPQDYDCFFGGHSYLKKGVSDHKFRFPMGKFRYNFIDAVAKRFNLALHAAKAYTWPGVKRMPEVFHPEYTTAMRRAKVTLNVNHFQFLHAYTRRTIRSIHAGRAHVTHYIPGMEDHFQNGKHLFWFGTIEEGLEQIKRLLKDKPLRNRMAAAALSLARREHSFKRRLIQFEDILEDLGI